ncbi:hypothetical protein CVT24_005404 [Panaeolus cyanescens]|uniref:Cytochrome P450 n=1 Tax=Panaeolus cyanescens TaxID=181874 RepID=A0A409Y8T2_9AGAR|nr:hypothetical protein CVT24_005404 [Panaeolus cyanescens]
MLSQLPLQEVSSAVTHAVNYLLSLSESYPYLSYAGGAVFVAIVTRWLAGRRRNPRGLPYPPGPRGLPFIGAYYEIPQKKPWAVYKEWSKKHGDLIFYKAMGHNYLIVQSLNRANDLFDKRSAIYSDRPPQPMAADLMGWSFNIGWQPYGSWWRRHRKAFHEHFNVNAVAKYDPIQTKELHRFLNRLLRQPAGFVDHIHNLFAAIIMKTVYGITISSDNNDPWMLTIFESLQSMVKAGIPGLYLVDHIPILKYIPSWFPGAEFKREAEKGMKITNKLVVKPYEAVKESLRKGEAEHSVVAALISDLPPENDPTRAEEEKIAADIGAVAYVAGGDTTGSALLACLLGLAMNPDAQKKAQAEIDACVGPTRLPDASDRPSLPYVDAVILETMRWHQVAPFAIAHMTSEDDEYDGYFIPKGTTVIGNSWAILNDESLFENPSAFNPDRYYKNPNTTKPDTTFGYGRRVCPGRYFSDRNLFAMISAILAVFDILPPLDERGNPVKLDLNPTEGLVSYPAPFSVRIIPRNENAAQLVRDLDH